MLMSHLQETIAQADIETQILYNRTMVQLGLCAFRQGMISAAHSALHDIWAGGRVKELLAQGIVNQRNQEKSAEEAKIEKRRQVGGPGGGSRGRFQGVGVDFILCVL